MALGDMNNDKLIDLVTLNADRDHFTVHYQQADTKTYTAANPVQVFMGSSDAQVASIVISKNMLDLQGLYVVYWKHNPSLDPTTYIKVFKQVREGRFIEDTANTINNLQI